MITEKIGNSRLLVHAGAATTDRATVESVFTPAPTATHFPIAHSFLLTQVEEALDTLGWTVEREAHALMGKNGSEYFGLLGLTRKAGFMVTDETANTAVTFAMGVRNSHTQLFRASGVLGTTVTVCDNMCFSGGKESVFNFGRKHTRYIERDLPKLVTSAFANLRDGMISETKRIEAYRNYELKNQRSVNDFLIRSLEKGACTATMLPQIIREWNRVDGCGGLAAECWAADPAYGRNTAWKLMQCYTETEKNHVSPVATPARNRRLVSMLDGLVGHGAEMVDMEN